MTEETEGTQALPETDNAALDTADTATPAVVDTPAEPEIKEDDKPKPDERDKAIRNLAYEAREAKRALREAQERLAHFEQKPANAPDIDQLVDQRIAEREQRERLESWVAKGNSDFSDFTERCNRVAELGPPQEFVDIVSDLDNGHKVVAHLADNPAEAVKLLALPPHRMAARLAQLSVTMDAKPEAKPKPVSSAPPPIKPVRGEVKAEKSLDDMTPEEYRAHRMKTSPLYRR